MYERERAEGLNVILKKRIYELGIKAQSMVKEIQEETDTFLSDKDFTSMNFSKVETLAKELKTLQMDYQEKAAELTRIRETFNITD